MPSAAMTSVWKRLHGRRSRRAGMSVSTMTGDAVGAAGNRCSMRKERKAEGLGSSDAPAQQEHRLFAEKIPEPPRRIEAQWLPPGVEGNRAVHPGAGHVAEVAEVLDGAEMDVRRIPPGVGQIVGARHVAAEEQLEPDFPMSEVRK